MHNNDNKVSMPLIDDSVPIDKRIKNKDIGKLINDIENGNIEGHLPEYYPDMNWEELETSKNIIEDHILSDKPDAVPVIRPMSTGKTSKENAYEIFTENGNKDKIFSMGNRSSSTVEFWNNTSYKDIGYHDKDGQYHECKDHLFLGSEDKIFGIIYCITKVLHFDPSIDYVQEAKERYCDPSTEDYNQSRINAVILAVNRASGVYDEASRVSKLLSSRKINKETYNNNVKNMNIPVIIKLWGIIPERKFTLEKIFYYHSATDVVIHKGYGRRRLPNTIVNAPNIIKDRLSSIRNTHTHTESIDVIDNEGSLPDNVWVSGICSVYKIKIKKDIDKKDGLYLTTCSYNKETGMTDKITRKRLSLKEAESILRPSKAEAVLGINKENAEKLLIETLNEFKEFHLYREKEQLKHEWFVEKAKTEARHIILEHNNNIDLINCKIEATSSKAEIDNATSGVKTASQVLTVIKALT